ncbi:hypothetical protein Tco_1319623, partial [Tanacetum coccineum]
MLGSLDVPYILAIEGVGGVRGGCGEGVGGLVMVCGIVGRLGRGGCGCGWRSGTLAAQEWFVRGTLCTSRDFPLWNFGKKDLKLLMGPLPPPPSILREEYILGSGVARARMGPCGDEWGTGVRFGGNGYRWQSQAPRNHRGAPAQTRSERVLEKPNEPPLPEGHTSGSKEGSMEHTFEIMDIVPPTPHDSPLTGGYTPGSDEGRLKLKELMAICTKLSKQVLDLEKEKDAQAVKILKLKQRVKKLERKKKSSISHPRSRIYRQVESSDNDLDEEDASKQGRDSDKTKSMFQDSDFDVLDDDIEVVKRETVHTAT